MGQAKLPPVLLPQFDGSDPESSLKQFDNCLRLSGVKDSSERFKSDWLVEACTLKVHKFVEKLVEETPDEFLVVLGKMEVLFP